VERIAQLVPLFNYSVYRENITYIEERMAQLVPLSIPLRLICLLSHCSDELTATILVLML
jgi:hypothetical protein